MKVVSFSLWGKDPKYNIGAIQNSYLAKYIYTGWEVRFYVADCVPIETTEQLIINGSKIINKGPANYKSMFWRFDPIKDSSVDLFVSRDTDSRLNFRERFAVEEWLNSKKALHIMRDHPWHATSILGGMWGLKGNIPDLDEMVNTFISNYYNLSNLQVGHYDLDQNFLRNIIYPLFKDNSIVHDEFFNKTAFPSNRESNEYVGAPYNEKDQLEIEFKNE